MVATRSYREIKADMLRRITGGEWPPGSLLPNETHLAQEYGSARATINRAMRELVEDGLVDAGRFDVFECLHLSISLAGAPGSRRGGYARIWRTWRTAATILV